MPPEPPFDPEEWSDEQWIAWLEATDPVDQRAMRVRPEVRRNAPAGVRLFGAAMLGMHEAIYGPSEDPDIVLVTDADGQGRAPGPIEVHLSRESHRATVVVRPSSAADGTAPDDGTQPNP